MTAVDLAVRDVELLPAETAPNLFQSDRPQEIIARATEIAQVLKEAVRKQNLTVPIGEREYPLVEMWTLCGTMLGVFAVCAWTRKLEDGWEARVEARTLAGAIVGAAEAQCTRSERLWRSREEYALRSMAQTRATSKALRQPLGFIMTLGGLEATPAEEMVGIESGSQFQPPPSTELASAPQVKNIDRLINKVTKTGVVDAVQLAERFQEKYGTSIPTRMTKAQASEVINGLMIMAEEESR